MHTRHAGGHAPVAFVGHGDERAGVGNAKINSADSDVGGEKRLTQFFASEGRHRRRVVRERHI